MGWRWDVCTWVVMGSVVMGLAQGHAIEVKDCGLVQRLPTAMHEGHPLATDMQSVH